MEYSPGSESAALTGDYVGVESCIDLRNEEEFEAYARDCERSYERRRRRKKIREAEAVGDGGGGESRREFPPPITFLARTENQPSHMPWVMKRYYTEDGRLVIREEKVRHHEYFRAYRADGRLTLRLVPLDFDTFDDTLVVKNEKEDDEEEEAVECDGTNNSNVDDTHIVNEVECPRIVPLESDDADDKDDVEVVNEEEEGVVGMVSSVSMSALCIIEGVRSGGMLTSTSSSALVGSGGGKKCYEFNSLRSSSASSLFHLQVPAIRPVIS